MSFGAHYKGDVSEVTMGHETGLLIEHDQPRTFTAVSATDHTKIEFRGVTNVGNTSIFEAAKPILKVPLGMLIGQKMTFHSTATGTNAFSSYYNDSFKSRVYTIVDHTLENNTDGSPTAATIIKIVPALRFPAGTSSISSDTGDAIFLHSLGLPTVQGDDNFAMNTAASSSKETSMIDQFIGLASFMTLPDTTVDLHSYHVVGLGRQVAVQQTGKVHHMGGSLELPLHSPKWLFYSLGREVVSKDKCGALAHSSSPVPTIFANVAPGQGFIDVTSSQSASVRFGSGTDAAVGDYLLIKDTTLVPTTTYKTPQKSTDKYWPPESSGSNLGSDSHHFEWAESSECRRISAIEGLGSSRFRLYVDGPWQFQHTTSMPPDTLELRQYHDSNTNGSPNVNTTRTITNPIHRLLFSAETIPSFSIEHSIRNRDLGSFNATSESTVAPGNSGDSKQLTRIFKGCKVVEWELSSTVDAELKYRCVFDALACYTDTGRLESSNKGDRYTAHRMFQNTADTLKGRKASGIADKSEKPFMFYNGTIQAFDQNLAFVTAFELRGKTGVELFHTIQSNPVAESVDSSTNLSLKQIPYGGTRNASIVREGREDFEMEITLALEDQTLFHELRTHIQRSGTVNAQGGVIMLHFTKPVTTGDSGTTPSLRVMVDDYFITELPIPMPDDKGLLFTTMKIKPQNIKVISEDTEYHC